MGKPKPVFTELINKYLNNEASAEERETLEKYYELFQEQPDGITGLSASEVQLLEDGLLMKIKGKLEPGRTIPFFRKPLVISAAAVLVLISVIALVFKNNEPKDLKTESLAARIQPGDNKATLVLGTGEILDLSTLKEGESRRLEGVSLLKKSNGLLIYQVLPLKKGQVIYSNVLHTLKTPKGGKYQVVLPDGSHVWLNAASSLTFSTNFYKNKRAVDLKGEAYFEIAKVNDPGKPNVRMPFTVKTDLQLIEVLGTHFNVNSYQSQESRTTLYEGKVKVFKINPVSKAKTNEFRLLKPGEELIVATSGIALTQAPLRANLAWKNDLFVFENEKIKSIMEAISRWYDVDVVYEGKITEENFNIEMPQDKDIKEVLETLEYTNLVHFKIEGRRLIVMP